MKRYVRASAEIAWVVSYSWNEGGPESGPIWGIDRRLIYARSKEEACRKFEKEYADDISGYEGCWARRATPEDIAEWESGEPWEEDLPFSSTRTKKRSIKAGYTREGALRNSTKFNSWTDAYQLITDTADRVIDKYGFDNKRINDEVSRLYSRYKHNRFFQLAYDRWCESTEEDW